MVVEHWTSCVLVACIGIRRTELTIVDSALGVTTIQHQSRRSFRQLPCSSRSHFGRRKLLFNSLSFQYDNCSRYLVRVYALIFFLFAHILARHLVVEGGKDRVFQTPTPVQITNVAFGEEISDANSRTVVKLTFESLTSGLDEDDDEEEKEPKSDNADERMATTVLCSLTPGKVY